MYSVTLFFVIMVCMYSLLFFVQGVTESVSEGVRVTFFGGGGVGCKSSLCIRFVSGHYITE